MQPYASHARSRVQCDAVAAFLVADGEHVVLVFCMLVIPMACIWFPEAMGDHRGFSGRGQSIDRESPPPGAFVMGWVLLFLPALVAPIFWWLGQ